MAVASISSTSPPHSVHASPVEMPTTFFPCSIDVGLFFYNLAIQE